MRLLLRLIRFGLVGFTLVLIAIIAFLATFDPNSYKKEIEGSLAKHKIYVNLIGDIEWQFYPEFGLAISQVHIYDEASTDANTLMSVAHASARLDLLPLLKRNVKLTQIRLEGVTSSYTINEQGQSNWDTLLEQFNTVDAQKPSPEPETPVPESAELSIKALYLRDIHANFSDTNAGLKSEIYLNKLELLNLNVNDTPGSFTFQGHISNHGFPHIHFDADGNFRQGADQQSLFLDSFSLVLTPEDNNQSAATRANDDHHTISRRFSIKGNSSIDLASSRISSRIEASMSPRVWLAIFAPGATEGLPTSALNQFSTTQTLLLEGNELSLSGSSKIDATSLTSELSVDLGREVPSIKTKIDADSITISDYTRPADSTNDSSNPEPSQATVANQTSEPSELPLGALRTVDIESQLTLAQVLHEGLSLDDIQLQISLKDALLSLDKASAQFGEGAIQGTGSLDARHNQAALEGSFTINKIDFGLLLNHFGDINNLKGDASGNISFVSRGRSDLDLMNNASADLELQIDQLQITPININKLYCTTAALLEGSPPSNYAWPDQSLIQSVSLNASYSDSIVNIARLTGEVEKLLVHTSGIYKTPTGEFDFPVRLRLSPKENAIEQCQIIDKKWQKRHIPIRCRDKIHSMDAATCKPDSREIKRILKQRLDEELEKEKDKLEKRLESEARDLLDDFLDDEDIDNLKKLFK